MRERDMPRHMTTLEWAREEAIKTVYVGTCVCMNGRGMTCPVHDAVARGLLRIRQNERDRAVNMIRERARDMRATSDIAMESGHTSLPSLLVAAELSVLVERIQAEDAPAT